MARLSFQSRLLVFVGFASLAGTSWGQLPSGFAEKVIASKATFTEATSMAHADDGRIFVTERGGNVKLIKGDDAVVVYKVSTTTDREQGLLKCQVHPDFAQKSWLYLYYMTADNNHHNITRLKLDQNSAVTGVDTVIKLPVLENMGRHNGSGMVFGKDGFLYVSRGQDELSGAANPAALWTSQKGKVLRFTDEGLPAPGNPHYNTAGASEGEKTVWARGFRNPWTLAYDPYSGRILEGDVGDGTEEINDVTQPDVAKDSWYGYGVGGGDGVNAGGKNNTIDPIYYHGTGAQGECAIVAEVPYSASRPSNWPAEYKDKIYIADYCGTAIKMVPLKNPAAPTDINNVASSGMKVFYPDSRIKVGLYVGIDGNLYYVNYGPNDKAYMIYNTAPTSLKNAATHSLNAQDAVLKMGGSSELRFTVMGEGPVGETDKDGTAGIAEFSILGADGKTRFSQTVAIRGGAFLAQGFKPETAGIFICKLSWKTGGADRQALGRLAVLP
jgi:glucose/arabinose dehydrogenase